MKKKIAYIFLASGFEETEAVGAIDVLRRGGVETVIVSVSGNLMVESVHGITIKADTLFENEQFTQGDAFILPGGGPGTENLNRHQGLKNLLKQQFDKGALIAAICAAPRVLGELGLLKGRNATCYPGCEDKLIGANFEEHILTAVDGNIITGQGPDAALDFGLEILDYLQGKEITWKVREDLLKNFPF